MERRITIPARTIFVAGWAIWTAWGATSPLPGEAVIHETKTARRSELGVLIPWDKSDAVPETRNSLRRRKANPVVERIESPADVKAAPADAPVEPQADPCPVDCPARDAKPCRARPHLSGLLQHMPKPQEPPAVYHHSEFHPVPVRPPLAPAWMGPGDDAQLRAARASGTLQAMPRVPMQRIEITPPPMPEQRPRTLPSLKISEDVLAQSPPRIGESLAPRSWIFATPELGRRDPAPIEALRPDRPASGMKR